ncbi:LysR substrate-binding domain-containing protein [Azospirillum sp.]|uniref:LysR substrate-binding domain-containing protein n=1 Tax=Azospirillum sp. TaxID=34012 RepID=UPI003D72CA86
MTLAGITLRDLEYLVAVADLRHFRQAAERCGVSQPGLSAQVAKLEERLGAPVFERGRTVMLTPFGEAAVAQARVVLAEARTLLDLGAQWRGDLAGPLRMASIETVGPYLFPLILRPLREAYPKAQFRLSEGRTAGLTAELLAGTIDLLLASTPLGDDRLVEADLYVEPFVVACAADHPLASADAPPPVDLGMEGLLLLDEGHCLRDQALAVCALGTRAARHATGLETLRHMIAAGEGWTLMPLLAARRSDADSLVRYVDLGPEGPGRRIGLVWRRSDPRGPRFMELAKRLRDLEIPGLRAVPRLPPLPHSGEGMGRGQPPKPPLETDLPLRHTPPPNRAG